MVCYFVLCFRVEDKNPSRVFPILFCAGRVYLGKCEIGNECEQMKHGGKLSTHMKVLLTSINI